MNISRPRNSGDRHIKTQDRMPLRNCLDCGKEFQPIMRFNRYCNSCKESQSNSSKSGLIVGIY